MNKKSKQKYDHQVPKRCKVHFLAGKGGVGKTLVAQALAKYFAIQGEQSLLISLSEEEYDNERPAVATINEIGSNLFHLKIYPDQALFEYLRLKIPNKLVDNLLAHSLIRALCSAIPGLSDLTRLGKIWFHADDTAGNGTEIFDKIVVDMPSSGFVNRFLTIANVVYNVVKIGPLASEALAMDLYFKQPQNAELHLVAILEELVINESIELWREITAKKTIHIGVMFINRVLSQKLDDLPRIDAKTMPHFQSVVQSLRQRIALETEQEKRLIDARILEPRINLPDQIGDITEASIVQTMIESIDRSQYFKK